MQKHDGFAQKLRPGHPGIAVPLLGLGRVMLHYNQPAKAEEFLREALDIRRNALPAGHWEIAEIESVLGGSLTQLGRFEEAETLLLASVPILRKAQGKESRITEEAVQHVLALYAAWNRPAKVKEFLDLYPNLMVRSESPSTVLK